MTPEDKAKMDGAAAEAEEEFHRDFGEDIVEQLHRWGMKWYPTAGYKRLGLIVSQRENFSGTI